jgi:hypothetical protein
MTLMPRGRLASLGDETMTARESFSYSAALFFTALQVLFYGSATLLERSGVFVIAV